MNSRPGRRMDRRWTLWIPDGSLYTEEKHRTVPLCYTPLCWCWSVMDKDLIYEVLSVVEEIPEGRVATYGQIARLTGRDRNARLIGKILSMAEFYGSYPCHRVVNHSGRTAPGFWDQRQLLEAEGVGFRANGCVDLKKHLWDC